MHLLCPGNSPAADAPSPGSLTKEFSSSVTDYPDLSMVPDCYKELKEVFTKAKATSLLPHRLYDCTMDLLADTAPKGWLYTLSSGDASNEGLN